MVEERIILESPEAVLRDYEIIFDGKIKYVNGRVYGHPGHPDGTSISTSAIITREGNIIVTDSGRKYRLSPRLAINDPNTKTTKVEDTIDA